MIIARSVSAYSWANLLIRPALMPVTVSAQPGVKRFTCSRNCAKPTVWLSINPLSCLFAARITFITARARAASVPGFTMKYSSARRQDSVTRTSMATTLAPRRFAAVICRPVFGWLAMLAPQRMIRSECLPMSSLVFASRFPVRPRPKPPNPQQIMQGSHHWQPYMLPNLRANSAWANVPKSLASAPWPGHSPTASRPTARKPATTRSSASSQLTLRHWSVPRVSRTMGYNRRRGLSMISPAAWPRTQRNPWLSGFSLSPFTPMR